MLAGANQNNNNTGTYIHSTFYVGDVTIFGDWLIIILNINISRLKMKGNTGMKL